MADASPIFSRSGKQVLGVLVACGVLLGGGGWAVLAASDAIDVRAAAAVAPVEAALVSARGQVADHEQRIRRLEDMAGDVKATRAVVEQLARERRR